MKMIKFRVLLSPLLLCLSCTAFAQVYKSTDADGNVTFSDTPSADSEEVQVEEANVADPVKVPVNTAPAPIPEVVKHETPPEATVHIDNDDGGGYRYRRHRAARKMGHRRR
jgi:hypothetical protein